MFVVTPKRALQRGISLLGLLFWAIVIAMIALVVLRVFPTVNEYLTIQRAVNKIATSGASSVPEIRAAFERQKEIEYSISSISGKDLTVTKENDQIVIGPQSVPYCVSGDELRYGNPMAGAATARRR